MLFPHFTIILLLYLGLAARSDLLSGQNPESATIGRQEAPASHILHERQNAHWSERWAKRDRIHARTLLPMRIGLVQRNLAVGADLLRKISDPTSEDYGKHLSAEEVIDLFAPTEATIAHIKEWLMSSGIRDEIISLSANKQWIQFDAHAGEVEDLLLTNFFEYEQLASGSRTVAVEQYHVPSHLSEHIDYITPGVKLRAGRSNVKSIRTRQAQDANIVKKRGMRATHAADSVFTAQDGATVGLPPLNMSSCDAYVTIDCIRAQYSIPNNTFASPGNELGFFEGVNDHYSRDGLDTFFSTLFPYIQNGTYPEERLIDGAIGAVEDIQGYNQSMDGGESDLDIQAAWPLIWPQKTVLFQTDDQFYEINSSSVNTPYVGFWNTFYDAIDGSYCSYSAYGETGDCTAADCLDPVYPDPNTGGYKGQLQCGVYRPTNVISISYSGGEADFPASYLKRQCSEIMKLSLQGVTVVESSGDYGVGSYPGDGGWETGCAGPDGDVFYPSADVTCPYVLSVGSTRFNHVSDPNDTTTYYETASGYSGGGFSNYFDAPEWQKKAIAQYFDEVKLDFTGYKEAGKNFSDVGSGVYRTGGRGYPDVSSIGVHYMSFTEGRWAREGGTSLSAPIWAAVITLINERRLAANKSTVGFLHPVLYAHPEVFTDITVGNNTACNSTGFLAAKGWDPVSGLGTPIFPKLVDLFLAL
ncbi:peptidase S8/S53 domain-containing protein [Penicillium nucicola]|uniref:peptidase S8/S53 domain-containing protein n=1 Tax=Penicillium nucicola TaxID=1850975 RepID=UPI0025456452|nr:peptidase S8/S53 domain-containing protein [Penicillium nucicola]KAJ5754101.1 peptidase S8/S53 domain-containing protein [Penicillium nucicola]